MSFLRDVTAIFWGQWLAKPRGIEYLRSIFLMVEVLRQWDAPAWLDYTLLAFSMVWHSSFEFWDIERSQLQVRMRRVGQAFAFLAVYYNVVWNTTGAAGRGEYVAQGFETVFSLVWTASKFLSLLMYMQRRVKPFLPSWVARAGDALCECLIPGLLSVLLAVAVVAFSAMGVVFIGLILDDASIECRDYLFTVVSVSCTILFPVLGWFHKKHLGNLLCFWGLLRVRYF